MAKGMRVIHEHHHPLMENLMSFAPLMMFGPMRVTMAMKAAAAKTKKDREDDENDA